MYSILHLLQLNCLNKVSYFGMLSLAKLNPKTVERIDSSIVTNNGINSHKVQSQ